MQGQYFFSVLFFNLTYYELSREKTKFTCIVECASLGRRIETSQRFAMPLLAHTTFQYHFY